MTLLRSIIPPRNVTPIVAPMPMTAAEMAALGWQQLDILLVSGDAYVDHPSFGMALIGRVLLAHGFKVGIVTQPRWEDKAQALADITCMGRPRLFAGVSAGAIDSMLAHYTAFRKLRHDDAYTPGGEHGARPNRAAIVYTGLLKQAFADIPVVLGGIEASLRRISHFDFWSDALRRPILCDSKADLLSYGMGEHAIVSIACAAELLQQQQAYADDKQGRVQYKQDVLKACHHIRGLAYLINGQQYGELAQQLEQQGDSLMELPSHEAIAAEASLLMQATLTLERITHQAQSYLVQPVAERVLVLTPPAKGLQEDELDFLYALPFTRLPHPSYGKPIPAWEMIRTSITTHRGCGGGCSFCSLALHQGRHITSRSKHSIVQEAERIAAGNGVSAPPKWAGAISDVGGPSANMWQATCSNKQVCQRASCLHPAICPFFVVDQNKGVALLRQIALLDGVNHVRIASGVRFDLALTQDEALVAYTSEFTGGQLKVAPEHCAEPVLRLMRKPSLDVFERFLRQFAQHARKAEKELYTVPYLMSAFPGCTKNHMQELADWLKERGWTPQQVQCFIPTPGTVATAMFYAGIAPDGSPLYVARTDKERLQQHHLLFGDSPHAAQQRRMGKRPSFASGRGDASRTSRGQSGRSARSDGKTAREGGSDYSTGGGSSSQGRDSRQDDKARRSGAADSPSGARGSRFQENSSRKSSASDGRGGQSHHSSPRQDGKAPRSRSGAGASDNSSSPSKNKSSRFNKK